MSEKNLKSLKFHGLDDIYKIPSTAEDVGAATLEEVSSAKTSAVNESKTYTDSQVRKAAPRNLLDNSDFRNPVNQRGQTTYTTDGYTIDRWCLWVESGNLNFAVNNGYISLSFDNHGTLYQRVEKGVLNPSKTYTLAYKKYNGGIEVKQTWIDYEGSSSDVVNVLDLKNGEVVNIEWVALYEGEYTIDTLPEYQPKGYGAELAECQRYYRKITSEDNTVICQAIAYNSTSLWGTLPFSMRISNPTIKFDNIVWTSNSISDASTVSSIGVNKSSCGITCVMFRVDGAVECTTYNIWTSGTGGYLEINADL